MMYVATDSDFTSYHQPNFNGKVAVVTGYAGFIGSHFTRQLLKDGWRVYGIDKIDDNEVACEFQLSANFEHYDSDIVTVKELPDCDYVFNFAAESHVSNSIEDSQDFVRTNVDGVRNLLELIRKKPDNVTTKPIFFHVSTDEVYGDAEGDDIHDERRLLNPSNPYSATKAAADMLILAWARTYELEYIIVRPTNNYGTNQIAEKLIPLTIKLLLCNKKVRLHNSGHPVRCWLNVNDTIDAFLILIEKEARGIYNISGPDHWTNRMIVSNIMKYMNVHNESIRLDLNYKRPGQDMRYAVDDTKLNQLGWNPKKKIEEELPGIIQWYLNDYNRLF